MGRHVVKLAVLAFFGFFVATGANAETIFDGTLLFKSTSNCEFTQTNWRFTSIYRVANVGGNPNSSAISTVWLRGAIGYTLPVGTFAATFKSVDVSGFNTDLVDFPARVRIISSVPATGLITATTPFVSVTGVIESPFGDPGVGGLKCLAGFRASYLLRR